MCALSQVRDSLEILVGDSMGAPALRLPPPYSNAHVLPENTLKQRPTFAPDSSPAGDVEEPAR